MYIPNSEQKTKTVCLPLAQPESKSKYRKMVTNVKKFVRYLQKTYQTFDGFIEVEDPRTGKCSIRMEDAICSVFMMFALGYDSMNSFYNAPLSMPEQALRNCGLSDFKECRIPGRDQAERILAMVPAAHFQDMLWEMGAKARRNKVFKDNQIDGHTIGILDAITMFYTFKKGKGASFVEEEDGRCPYCQEAVHRDGSISSQHRVEVLTIPGISGTGTFALNFEFLLAGDPNTKSEGELTAAKRLLKALVEHLPGLCDIITGDALYANAPFLAAVEAIGAIAVVNIKGDNRLVIEEAEKRFAHGEGKCMSFKARNRKGKKFLVQAWYDDDFTLAGRDKPVQMVQFTETPYDEEGNLVTSEERVVYMLSSNTKLDIKTIWKILHLRWDIEDTCFHVLSTHHHVKHMFSHKACAQMFGLMLLAFNAREMYLFRNRARDFVGRCRRKDFMKRIDADIQTMNIAESIRPLLKSSA